MRRRRLLLLSLVLSLVAAWSAFFVWVRESSVRIDEDGFALIEIGMMESEVERVLGGPAGKYRSRPRFKQTYYEHMRSGSAATYAHTWRCDTIEIVVGFSDEGKVVHKTFGYLGPAPSSWFDKGRALLGI